MQAEFGYRLHGIDVVSNAPLDGWPPADNLADPWLVDLADSHPGWFEGPFPPEGEVFINWGGGDAATSVEVHGAGDLGSLRLEWHWAERRIVARHTIPGAGHGCADLMSRWVLPDIARRERGALPLHAAAIRVGDGVVLVCGESGRGKSTLGGALIAGGGTLVGDEPSCPDSVGGGARVFPGRQFLEVTHDTAEWLTGRGLALDPSTAPASGKSLIVGNCPPSALPLAAIVMLQPRRASGPVLEASRLVPLEAMTDVMGQRYARAHQPDRTRLDFVAAAQILSMVPVLSVSLLDDLDAAAEAAAELAGEWVR